MARESGLSVSALRFYDAAGVLRPARVDPMTGYRWYAAEQVSQARLIASLRRVSMPLADICEVLAARHDTVEAGRLLDRHLRRLEQGLTDARGHLGAARDLLEQDSQTTEMTVLGSDLIAAVHAVRFAASTDLELRALGGVLFDYDGNTLRLVASDRYRLAVATVITRNQHGPAAKLIAPLALLDELALQPDQDVRIALHNRDLTLGGVHVRGIDAVFPDYQRLLQTSTAEEITVTRVDLIERLRMGPTRTLDQPPNSSSHEVSVVVLDGESVQVIGEDHPDAIAFNREFLLQALGTRAADRLVLALDGPVRPLAIRDPDRPCDVSLLMPTRLC